MSSCRNEKKFDFRQANAEQKKAITTTEGPVLIIAGPGTGKTFTLVKRIAYLMTEKKVAPREIMAITFTKKAAMELLTRISDEIAQYELNVNLHEMYIGTFHAVCLRLLKENAEIMQHDKGLRLLDAFEQTYLVYENLNMFNQFHGYEKHIKKSNSFWEQAAEICRYVNQLREELVDIAAMERDTDEDVRFLAKLLRRYESLLLNSNAIDFAALQTETYAMLKSNPQVLCKISNTLRYIMVDEYQDTNYIEEQLIFLLAGERENICVVGDDDQGLYRFRGATIRNILEFPNKFAQN